MNSNKNTPELATIVASAATTRRSPWRRVAWITAGALVVAIAVPTFLARGAKDLPLTFTTQPIRKGDLRLTITATGNLEPTNEVTVGSELSGLVLEVYVDTNDQVKKGQPLAKIDTSKLEQQIAASRAALNTAEAKVTEAQATLHEAEAALARQQELNRVSNGRMPSKADLVTAQATVERAVASVASAKAGVDQAQAQLNSNENDLRKAVIVSPIDGIVLTRSVEPGQTVAASFTAPELFVIAESLEQMKLNVSVAEADIGRVKNGQTAQFTVDAWPNKTYDAVVRRVAYGSTVSSNVVSYVTELEVNNKDLTLRPGMTATADIHVAHSQGVLLVPTSALRFDPTTLGAAPTAQSKTFLQSIMPMPPRPGAKRPTENEVASPGQKVTRVHVLKDGHPEPVTVRTGLNDGKQVEVSGDGLVEGLPVILRAVAAKP